VLATIGIIGCGAVAQTLHLPALARIPGVQVVAAADPDPAQRSAMARFQIPKIYADHRDLLADPAITAVAILTPPATHAAIGSEALAAGKAVLIEKPLTLTLEEADRLLAAEDSSVPRMAAVGFNLRHHPFVQAAKEAVSALEPVAITSIFAIASGGVGWRKQPDAGAEALLELGTHHFDLWRFLFAAEIESVSAFTAGGAVVVNARLQGGAVATGTFMTGGFDAHRLEIVGTHGHIDAALYRFDGLRITRGAGRHWAADGIQLARGLINARGTNIFATSYVEEWRAFLNGQPTASLYDGRQALAIALAARESLATGKVVTL